MNVLNRDNCGFLSRRRYDKGDNFDFDIVNYPYLDSNIPVGPAYSVYTSRLVAFARRYGNMIYGPTSLEIVRRFFFV